MDLKIGTFYTLAKAMQIYTNFAFTVRTATSLDKGENVMSGPLHVTTTEMHTHRMLLSVERINV